jgi:Mlc titration factor MtfA (ptsG expression regulator)
MRVVRRSTIYTTTLLAVVVGGAVALVAAQRGGAWSALGLVPAVLILAGGLRRAIRRRRVARTPMPSEWRAWLSDHIPPYSRLDDDARARFERDVRFVIDEYNFEGVQGVEVTDSLRLSVAAGAALLLHGRPDWELPGSRSVVLYPARFNESYYDGADADYDGMAHQQGPILLSAPSVRASWADPGDADNVVLHELAHLFDFDNEGADGVPSFVAPASAASWQALVRREMQRVRRGQSILRPYAAEAPSEFFAVAVEAFFEQPGRMARHHEDLFAAMVAFFHFDPRTGRATPEPDPAAPAVLEASNPDRIDDPERREGG